MLRTPRTRLTAVGAAASLALALAACGGEESAGPTADPEEIVLSLVPSGDVDSITESAKGLESFLSKRIGIPVRAEVTESYAAAIVAMKSEQAQVAMLGPIGVVQAEDQAGAVPILQSVRYGSGTYHTQWFTNDPETYCTDEVKVVEGLKYCNGTDAAETGPAGENAIAKIKPGTSIAFVDQGSASGYYYPATQWGQVSGGDALVDLDAQFAGDHDAAVLSVARGDYPIGVSFDDAREEVAADEPKVASQVVVFAYSNEIPNDGIVVAGGISKELRTKITDAFTAMAKDPKGIKTLHAVYEIEGLEKVDTAALKKAKSVEEKFGE
ncbi:phosphonate transport system substrate-binding protein [Nocardioides luteus]|uniref:Phosphonate ABC transporter substrate-binding protein n=1 Tax=Nocardioides luteus TaxID=1844 RepID=A0ABQ5SUB7_9ACTN|nr:phosphate/phosphite/phosphonate ABC transporter substrate-binding protein [Nocardioides luteus]MDR7309928.1 phosphonate transport system substrate-binding protein [Nocardioides luteus]GGR59540.1 phosphonate ABC transporter substrate-binding protein [Nocardioides luteus]GLJ67163.1 phosphonate ABC transporter substrate-binding protein [Nocardioides luteus]